MDLKKLINCVYSRKSIWDQKHEGYNNKVLLRKIWQEVAEEMKSPADVCRQKWRSLRDVFRRELKKYHSRLTDPNVFNKSPPRWYYFSELHFLTDQMLGLDRKSYTPEHSEETFESTVKIENDSIDDAELLLDSSSDILLLADEDPEEDHEMKKSVRGLQGGREVLKRHINNDYNEHDDRKRPKIYDSYEDSDYHFLMSLLPFLRDVPHNKKMVVRTKMQNIFCEEMSDK